MDNTKLQEAITLLNRGKYQQAKAMLEEIVVPKPDNADPYRLFLDDRETETIDHKPLLRVFNRVFRGLE